MQSTRHLLPPANEVCRKVIFSVACVKNSVHGGGGGSTWAGTPPRQVHLPPGRYSTPRAGTPPPRQVHPPPGRYTPWAGTPPLGRYTSPWPGTPPSRYTPGQVHPRGRCTSPWPGTAPSRYTSPWPGTPPSRQAPLGRCTPPGQVHLPGAVHAGRYGQQAGSTHPTGMYSCFDNYIDLLFRTVIISKEIPLHDIPDLQSAIHTT